MKLTQQLTPASRFVITLLCAFLGSIPVSRAYAAAATPAVATPVEWVDVSAHLPFKSNAIAIDRTTGDVYALPWESGLWKSTDHAATFTRIDGGFMSKGGAESSDCMDMNPAGHGLACFIIYGSSGITLDAGKTWEAFSQSHMDFGVVDWSDPQARSIMASNHESGFTTVLSRDRGKTWRTIGKGYQTLGIPDSTTLLIGDGASIKRSVDDGATWTTVSNFAPTGNLMRTFKGRTYCLTSAGLAISADAGLTWTIPGSPVHGNCALMIGRDEHQLVAASRPFDGFWQSEDGGVTWQRLVDHPPPGFNTLNPPNAWFRGYGFDPNAGIYYANGRGQSIFTLRLKPSKADENLAERLLGEIAKTPDDASPESFKARIKVYVGTAGLFLNAEQRAHIDAWVAPVREDVVAHQGAVRLALAQQPIRKDFSKILAEHAKPYRGTALDSWFHDAGTVVAITSAVATFEAAPIAGSTRDQRKNFVEQVESVRRQVSTREFLALIDALAARARTKAAL